MKSPKILVLGGSGMLGHKIFQTLRDQFPETFCTIRKSSTNYSYNKIPILQGENVISAIDGMAFDRVENYLVELRPDFVVNCIGIIKQRGEAKVSVPSISINSLLPHRLASLLEVWGGRLIHFSTDCVFSGRTGNYTESDNSDAEDLYGKSKSLGEVTTENALTLRTSIIGRELTGRESLLEWFLSQNHGSVKGYRRVIYSGTTTNQIAILVRDIIKKHYDLSGLYQVVSTPISKHDLLCKLREAYQLDIDVTPEDGVISDRSMRGDKLRDAIGYVSPPWEVLVRSLADDPTPYNEWRTMPSG